MKTNALFSKITRMTEMEAMAFMEAHPSESYQLVDVRQPAEYEESHLPGALLVPLNLLMAGSGDLNPDKPAIVYCRSGGRSAAAAQYLAGQGFKEVYDIGDHIASWLGLRVAGAYDANLDLIRPEAEFPDAWTMAYALEEGLQRFYFELEAAESREPYQQLFRKLAKFENRHKDRLVKAYGQTGKTEAELALFMKAHPEVIEGGDANRQSPLNVIGRMQSLIDVISLSMAMEARSQDLYFRLSQQSTDAETRKLFLELADEEKMHLSYLAEEMNRLWPEG
jgi:sulfur-carrier protein adenylyltransferase/sulfurtransferase